MVGVPPRSRYLDANLDNVPVAAFHLAAGGAPTLVAVAGVGDGILVAVEVAGFATKRID